MTWVDWWRWYMWNKHQLKWIGVVLLVLLVSGCQSKPPVSAASPNTTQTPTTKETETNTPSSGGESTAPAKVAFEKWTSLPDKIIGNVVTVDHKGGIFSVGGYNGKHSIDKIYRIDDQVKIEARLPVLMHDEAAGWIGDTLYIIGGGQSDSYDTIYKMSPDKKVKLDSHFPVPVSDLNAVPFTLKGTPGLMIIGGYNGQKYDKKVRMLRRQGQTVQLDQAFLLPVGLRYGAVTTDGHDIFVAGGKSPSALSDKVYVWSDKDQKIKVLASLPTPREKAAAFVFQNRLWIIGGIDGKGKVLDQVVEVDTDTGKTQIAEPFPTPIADMGYSQDQNSGYLAGGQTSKQQYSSIVYRITVSH
jgi:hypothetical protein